MRGGVKTDRRTPLPSGEDRSGPKGVTLTLRGSEKPDVRGSSQPAFVRAGDPQPRRLPAMSKWECTACSYIYDPEKGDPENGVAPGTPWKDVPGDWVCPDCGLGKDAFEEVSE